MLSEFFEQAGCEGVHARGDADLLIVQTAVAVSADRETIVVADDTDILVLLCHFVNSNSKAIFMKPESRHGSKEAKFWDIHVMKSILGDGLCKHLPFIHALLGCDTTSCLFGIGKALAMKKYSQLQQHAEMFCKPDTSQADIITSGEKALVVIYGGKSSDTLNTLRCHRFVEKMSRSTISIEMKALPPTSAAAKYHSMQVYYQVQVWLGNNCLVPTEWGWKVEKGFMSAIMSDMPPAPENLLKLVRCSCRTDCSTARCSCRKHGFDCSSACGECHGTACSNSPVLNDDLDSEMDMDQ